MTATVRVVPRVTGWGTYIANRRKTEGVGLTQDQLADACGVSKGTVWAWEQEKVSPAVDRLPLLADALKVPMAYLLKEFGITLAPRGAERLSRRLVDLLLQLNEEDLADVEKNAVRSIAWRSLGGQWPPQSPGRL